MLKPGSLLRSRAPPLFFRRSNLSIRGWRCSHSQSASRTVRGPETCHRDNSRQQGAVYVGLSGLFLLGGAAASDSNSPVKCHGTPCQERRQRLANYLQSSPSRASAIDVSQLPEFSSQDVSKRNGQDGSPTWMSYGGFVMDVTEFIPLHPGGTERISRAAGAAIEPFWYLHQQHFDTEEPLQIMKGLIVGRLVESDQVSVDVKLEEMEDALDAFQLEVVLTTEAGGDSTQYKYSLNDLKALPKTDAKSQVGCLQNQERRPVSTSTFGGVRLEELLPPNLTNNKSQGQVPRLTFHAMDGETVVVEVDSATYKDYLVCYEMDGLPLTKGRGFPLRIIIPGKRVVKWVQRIDVGAS